MTNRSFSANAIPSSSEPRRRRTSPIHTVSSATFEELVLRGAGPIVVEFMSYGCAYCRAVEGPLQAAAEALESTERFFRVNVALEEDLATFYRVKATPTFVMFLDGEEVGRAEGPQPSAVMRAVTQPFAT